MPETQTYGTILKNLVIGIIAVLALTGIKVFLVEDTPYDRWMDARGYELLHSIISPFDPGKKLSVAVLDISDVPRLPNGATPTEPLQKIVQALVEGRAKAIAIDIDFSPSLEPVAQNIPDDRAEIVSQFYAQLQDLNKRGIPVFVGAFNIGPEPETWLGLDENKNLAADITLFDEDTTLIPRWLRCDGGGKLNSMSMALAKTSKQQPSPNSMIKPLLDEPEAEDNLKTTTLQNQAGQDVECKRSFTFVNYSKLDLMQNLTLQWAGREALLSAKDASGKGKFENKLVLVGNTQRGKFTDPFVVAGRRDPVAGVYLHASATYSLVDEPIYKFKHRVEIAADLILGCGLVFTLFLVRLNHLRSDDPKKSSKPYLSEGLIIFGLTVITLTVACLLVRFFDVLWLDVSLVIVALFLHSKVQEWFAWILNKLFKIFRRRVPTSAE